MATSESVMSTNLASPINEIGAERFALLAHAAGVSTDRLHTDLSNLKQREIEVLANLDLDEAAAAVRANGDRSRLLAVLELGDRADELADAGLTPAGQRRTKVEMCQFRLALYEEVRENRPISVRGAFYKMVRLGLPKTESQYARVQDELVKMRRGERLPVVPYGWIVDGVRLQRKPTTYSSLDRMLHHSIRTYRRAVWEDQDVYVEIWCEKDTLAGVLYPVTAEWDVPLMVTRGFSSVTFIHNAAEAIEAEGKPAFIYFLTDHDRSGRLIADKIEAGFREFAPDAEIHCEQAAVTEGQINEFDLPTRPPKRKGDPPAVELDAIPPDDLRAIVRDCIERHVDPDALRRTKQVEKEERRTLKRLSDRVRRPS